MIADDGFSEEGGGSGYQKNTLAEGSALNQNGARRVDHKLSSARNGLATADRGQIVYFCARGPPAVAICRVLTVNSPTDGAGHQQVGDVLDLRSRSFLLVLRILFRIKLFGPTGIALKEPDRRERVSVVVLTAEGDFRTADCCLRFWTMSANDVIANVTAAIRPMIVHRAGFGAISE